ncbi:MAG: hypothetical protein V1867_00700 [Candidatus Falkowbacteria bacterium]
MSITPEQFKEILKETVNDELGPIKEKIDQNHNEVIEAIDGLAKEVKDSRIEKLSNQVAHDRMQNDIVRRSKSTSG